MQCRTSGRSAPSDADDTNGQPLILTTDTTRTTGWTDWRQEDLDLLAELIGSDKVTSDGTVSPEGTYPVQKVYEGLRNFPGGPKEWPGRWLQQIHDSNPDSGVLDWLARYGLEPAP